MLQRGFEESEVLRYLKLCATDKAPGLDGFTMGSFIKCWEILKQDIMLAFKNFFTSCINFFVFASEKKVYA